jgi:hypothetical protein
MMPRDQDIPTTRDGSVIPGLVRIGLMAAALLAAATVIAVHGVRGLAIVIFLALLASLPRSRPYRTAEYWLVRITGSRRGAAVVFMTTLIVVLVAFNVYTLTH